MVVIELRFPAGRYHATPFGRNVNEGIPEWPPSPYRLARALADACFRKAPEIQGDRLEKVLDILAAPVSYRLPKVSTSHARYFLSENLKNQLKRQKVFDPFVVISREDSVLMSFQSEPSREALFDLKHLLGFLNYFGRSESWVSAALLSEKLFEANCSKEQVSDSSPSEIACLKTRDDYESVKTALQEKGDRSLDGRNWVEAVCMGTRDMKAEGWNLPPAMQPVTMYLSRKLIDSGAPPSGAAFPQGFRLARYSIDGKVKPLVTDSLMIAERMRRKLMGIHRVVMGDDPAKVSRSFSGKNPDSTPLVGHEHTFILPIDLDGDGRLDTVIVTAKTPFDNEEVLALNRLNSLWQDKGRGDLNLVLTGLLKSGVWMEGRTWVSATPFVTARHHRKGRGDYQTWLQNEIQLELSYQNLPPAEEIEMLPKSVSSGHSFHWIEFVRSRKGETPLPGSGFKLTFKDPIEGPFALGSLCHFGLGLFLPEER